MKKYCQENERVKHRYLEFLREARRQSESSLDAVAKAINRFEDYTRYRDFKSFRTEQAVGFKNHLLRQKSESSGKSLSKSTINSTLNYLKGFFEWLSREPGYKSRISFTDAEFFHLSEKDTRVATAKRNRPVPTLEQIKAVLDAMPLDTDLQKRDRALIAFIILTGVRDRAVASLRLKHVDLRHRCVIQDAREVATKFSKTFNSYFFPVGHDVELIVTDWVSFLRHDKLWGDDDPLFPSTLVGLDENHMFQPTGLDRVHWQDAGPIRRIFKTAFENAGLPYYNPHSFRNTLVRIAGERCSSPEEYKAWSQNLGHEKPLTTFLSYGYVEEHRQKELIAGLVNPISRANQGAFDLDSLAAMVAEKVKAIS